MTAHMQEARWWLEQWGLWARSGATDYDLLRYRSPFAVALDANVQRSGGGERTQIPEVVAMEIDRHLSRLHLRSPKIAGAIVCFFLYGKSYGDIASIVGVPNRKQAAALVDLGLAWMDAAIYGLTEKVRDRC